MVSVKSGMAVGPQLGPEGPETTVEWASKIALTQL